MWSHLQSRYLNKCQARIDHADSHLICERLYCVNLLHHLCEWLSNSSPVVDRGRDNTAEVNPVQSLHCVLSLKMWACSDPLQVFVEAKSSLYRCTQSSLKRDFTRLMWDDRWILGRESDKQITGELRVKSSRGQQLCGQILTSQTCGFAHRYMPTLW